MHYFASRSLLEPSPQLNPRSQGHRQLYGSQLRARENPQSQSNWQTPFIANFITVTSDLRDTTISTIKGTKGKEIRWQAIGAGASDPNSDGEQLGMLINGFALGNLATHKTNTSCPNPHQTPLGNVITGPIVGQCLQLPMWEQYGS